MLHPNRVLAFGVCSALLLLGCEGRVEESTAGEIAAVVDGSSITISELDDWIRDDLYRQEIAGNSPSQMHLLRTEGLRRMIEERVMEAEASRSNLDPSQVLERELEALGPITDEEVESFYAERADRLKGATLEELTPRIREYLQQKRASAAVARLREQANVTVLLEPPRVAVEGDGPSLGPAEAAVTIVEFSDFQCPFCERAIPVLKELRERYPNDVRVVYRHFPLDSIHPRARPAAEASLCAHDQGKFWPYHDKLFENPAALADDDLRRYATELELDADRFERCVAERPHREAVEADAAAASEAGVNGTPAFFVNGIFIEGAQPASAFIELIDAELVR
jgi:protein-disulfide isomerase